MTLYRYVAVAAVAAITTGVAIACSSPEGVSEQGPSGLPGPQGAPGAQGAPGEAGPPGAGAALAPAGVIVAYGGPSSATPGSPPPVGWLLCDGSTVSRTTYADLFAAVGVNFGEGDGSATFNLPDLRGRFLRGVDADAGRDPDNATRAVMSFGGNTGDAVGTIQADQLKSHAHSIGDQQGQAGGGTAFSGVMFTANSGFPSGSTSTANTGGTETRPINAYVNYIIKY